MTDAPFHRLTRTLWGDDWRSGLTKLLERNGYSKPSRMTLWRWDNEKAPSEVVFLLEKEAKRRKCLKRPSEINKYGEEKER